MKKKRLLILTVIIVTLLLLLTLTILAITLNTKIMLELVGAKQPKETQEISSTNDDEKYTKLIEQSIDFLNSCNAISKSGNTNEIHIEEFKIEQIKDDIEGEEFYRVQGNNAILDILEDCTIKAYLNINSKNMNLTEEDLKNFKDMDLNPIAEEIFNKTAMVNNKENYTLTNVQTKELYFPTACFESNIDKNILFFAFDPNTFEILNMGNKKMTMSQNNEIIISEQEAKEIAIKQMETTVDEIKKVELTEVVPNECFVTSDEYIFYKKFDYKRNAYVVTFNDTMSTEVYVDATTGEVIGGNASW